MQKIIPCLWFDGNAQEAVNFYTSIFKNSKIKNITHYNKEGSSVSKMPEGSIMTINFELEGQEYMALNGGPDFKFNEAISFMVNCDSQEELDEYWDKLSAGGEEVECGWLKDKYGLSWQIVPTILYEYMADKNPEKYQSVMNALLKMKKIVIDDLKEAYDSVKEKL